jgi:hypothetical protein
MDIDLIDISIIFFACMPVWIPLTFIIYAIV